MRNTELQTGIVVASMGLWSKIMTSDSTLINARVRGKFKQNELSDSHIICVGDRVKYAFLKDQTAVIEEVEKRTNWLSRNTQNTNYQTIASNIDLVVLIISLKNPKTSFGFIDRLLVACDLQNIPVLLVFNKLDIFLTDKDQKKLYKTKKIYEAIGYDTLCTSAEKNMYIDELKEKILHKTSVLTGISGVGKSSLLNLLIPKAQQKVKPISHFSKKGIHTTSYVQMFRLNKDTDIIDIPGIKSFGLNYVEPTEIAYCFPEFRIILENQPCQYRNCLHTRELQCSIREAVKSQKISEIRYKSYLSIQKKINNRTHEQSKLLFP